MALQPYEVDKFTTITEEKYLKDDLVNFTTITMSRWSCIISHMAFNNEILPSLYGNYFTINLDYDGIRQVAQVLCSFAALCGS